MGDSINIEIKVSKEEYEKLLKKKGNKPWKKFLVESALAPNTLEKFGIVNDIEVLAVEILQEDYNEARETALQILNWIDEKLKEKEKGTNQEHGD